MLLGSVYRWCMCCLAIAIVWGHGTCAILFDGSLDLLQNHHWQVILVGVLLDGVLDLVWTL